MVDLYLRTGNAGAMAMACPFLRSEEQWLIKGPGFVADYIGVILVSPAVYNEAGVQTYAEVWDEGFHVNLRCTEEVAAMVSETIQVSPATPRRLWA